MKVADKLIGNDQPCFIIAEAGVNHNGNIETAKKLIDIAKHSGADAVKFQTWITEEIMLKDSPMAEYVKQNTNEVSQYKMLKKLELSFAEFRELKDYADKKGIIFLSTPDDEKSVDFLYILGVPAFKIGSGELTNLFMLEKIAKTGLPIILSTGMGDLEEVRKALQIINSHGNSNVVLLHCTTNYPTQIEDVNLRAMQTLKTEFKTLIGYSDHTISIYLPAVAVALGASIIEKHFTFDKNADGPDHKASLSPNELKKMVALIRTVEKALGEPTKKPVQNELANKNVVRKSLVAKQTILTGTTITKEMLTAKRPGTGISPLDIELILGKKAKKNILQDCLVNWEMLE